MCALWVCFIPPPPYLIVVMFPYVPVLPCLFLSYFIRFSFLY
uniref:Uncharacterized protein n=1 Tax=Anguilla anguilla TaxID=7936 RepID=A0A0E9XNL3_ANGAN